MSKRGKTTPMKATPRREPRGTITPENKARITTENRIVRVLNSVKSAGGDHWSHINMQQWKQIGREVRTELEQRNMSDLEMANMAINKIALLSTLAATVSGLTVRTVQSSDKSTKSTTNKNKSEQETLSSKTSDLKLKYVVNEMMQQLEPFDGSQSWPVWRAAAELRMVGMDDTAKITYIKAKTAGIFRMTSEIACQNVLDYGEFIKILDKIMKTVPDQATARKKIYDFKKRALGQGLLQYFVEFDSWTKKEGIDKIFPSGELYQLFVLKIDIYTVEALEKMGVDDMAKAVVGIQ